MQIAHLSRVSYPYHPYGGLEQHVYRLTRHLALRGQDVQLFIQPPDSQRFSEYANLIWPGAVTMHYTRYQTLPILRRNSIPDRLLNYPLFSQRLAIAVAKLNPSPDVVHAHGLAAWGYARKPLSHVPLVLNPHGMEEFKVTDTAKRIAYTPFRAMLRHAARHAAAVIATDSALVPEVERYLKVPPSRIKLIPNAVELAPPTDKNAAIATRTKYSLSPDVKLLLSVGRLEANKGFEVMLKALALLHTQNVCNWRWVLVGTGSQKEKLAALTTELKLEDKVSFAGTLPDVELEALYNAADVFVHPTLYEGSSLVTLEAMSHALPIIASNTGGLPDKVFAEGPHHNGWLVLPSNAEELAAYLKIALALSSTALTELGQQSRYLVETRFSWEVAAQQTLALYQSLK